MRLRRVTGVERRERSTILKLECGHDRSIGGHVFMSARISGDAGLCREYPCEDDNCGKAA